MKTNALFMALILAVYFGISGLLTTPAFADTANLNVYGYIYQPPWTVQTDQNMSIKIMKNSGKTAYTTVDSEWVGTATNPAKMMFTGDAYAPTIVLTVPATVTLTNGAETATVSFICRTSTTAYVADKVSGTACSSTTAVSGTNGRLYLSAFPTGATFTSNNVSGQYTGTLSITADYP